MKKRVVISTIFCLLNSLMFSQENGYWYIHAIRSQVISLSHGESKGITIELPRGTSKFSYKIKIISQYANATYDFADMFKNSLDPRFRILSQTAKIAVSATDPKIRYSIESFSNNQKSLCYSSNGIITGTEINFFDSTKINCINTDENTNVLNFYFKNENQFFPLKVIFEYIPYIDYELQRGWSKNLKNNLYNLLLNKLKESLNNIGNNEIKNGLSCILSNVVKDYTLEQFKSLADYEQQNYFSTIIKKCGLN